MRSTRALKFYRLSEYLTAYRREWFIEDNISSIRLNIVLWSILMLTNLTDIIFSYKIFSEGGVEINPLMSALCTKFGNVALSFYKGFILGVLFILLPYVKNKLQSFLLLSCIAYIILVISHVIRFLL